MSSRDISLAISAAITLAVVMVELAALAHPQRVASLGRLLGRVMRTRPGRVGIVTGWVWLGLHFFGR